MLEGRECITSVQCTLWIIIGLIFTGVLAFRKRFSVTHINLLFVGLQTGWQSKNCQAARRISLVKVESVWHLVWNSTSEIRWPSFISWLHYLQVRWLQAVLAEHLIVCEAEYKWWALWGSAITLDHVPTCAREKHITCRLWILEKPKCLYSWGLWLEAKTCLANSQALCLCPHLMKLTFFPRESGSLWDG